MTLVRRLRRWGLWALGLVCLVLLVAASGVVTVTASSGHWPITAWFLHFAMERSVATHSLGIAVPEFDDQRSVLRGAGHYHTGCRPCHGAPDLRHPVVPQGMTPKPPYLPPRLPEWDDEDLFYVVKHGIKMTGMPAWPAPSRDDEVWAMVAFLRRLPDLDVDEYRALVHDGAVAAGGDRLAAACARCHGEDGRGRGEGAFPVLAGQRTQYLQATLEAYATGARHSGIMQPIAAELGPQARRALALHYASLPPAAAAEPSDAGAVARGAVIAREGVPAQRVPSCIDCHGPGGPEPTRRDYPTLAGQAAAYLELQLDLFARGARGGSPYASLMHEFAPALRPPQRKDVAAYYASLPGAADGR